jgi:hypothetical protein
MHNVTVNQDTWAARADEAGVSLELLAVLTGKSYSAVYRYKTGSRVAPQEWLDKVGLILTERALRGEATA